tara:strand:- start:306 stop:554 length:249 start_codon:yes stop_codon:yes gene_type:complete
MLESFGVPIQERPDGMVIEGDPDRRLRPGHVDARGDHRIAMCGALLSMIAPEGTSWEGAESVTSSFPGFVDTLRALGAELAL